MEFLQTLDGELAAVNMTNAANHPENKPCSCCRPLGTMNEDGRRIYILMEQLADEHNKLADEHNKLGQQNPRRHKKQLIDMRLKMRMIRQKRVVLGEMLTLKLWEQFPEQAGDDLRICRDWQILPEAQIEAFVLFGGGFGPDISFGSRRGN